MTVIPAAMRRLFAEPLNWFDSPLHWADTGLRPGRSLWRSGWARIIALVVLTHLVLVLLGIAQTFFGDALNQRYHPTHVEAFSGVISMVSLVMLMLLMALSLNNAAKSWARDSNPEWREHLGVLPITGQTVIAAKSHVWLTVVLVSKGLTMIISLAWTIIGILIWSLTGKPPYADVFLGENGNTAINLSDYLWGNLFTALLFLTGLIMWVLAFGVVTLASTKWNRGPSASFFTAVGLNFIITMGLGFITGFLGVQFFWGGSGYLFGILLQLVYIVILGAITWALYRKLPGIVAERYNLTS